MGRYSASGGREPPPRKASDTRRPVRALAAAALAHADRVACDGGDAGGQGDAEPDKADAPRLEAERAVELGELIRVRALDLVPTSRVSSRDGYTRRDMLGGGIGYSRCISVNLGHLGHLGQSRCISGNLATLRRTVSSYMSYVQ